MGRASGSKMSHWIRNNIPDFLRAMSVKMVKMEAQCAK